MIGIKGMELPKSCAKCRFKDSLHGIYYCLFNCEAITDYGWQKQRADFCKLVDLGKEDMFRQEIAGCLARGYCSDENCNKELDANLIKAMVDEIFKLQTIKSLVGDER